MDMKFLQKRSFETKLIAENLSNWKVSLLKTLTTMCMCPTFLKHALFITAMQLLSEAS